MNKSFKSFGLMAATAVTAVSLFGTAVHAREAGEAPRSEGKKSIGKGIKCTQRLVPQADGTLKLQQVCFKSI